MRAHHFKNLKGLTVVSGRKNQLAILHLGKRKFFTHVFMNLEYLTILLLILFITVILEKANHVHLYHNRKERLEIVGLFFLVGVLWDTFAIWRGHWVFPAGKTFGITIGLMPLEEYLFMLILPYSIITFYKLIDSKFRKK